MTPDEIADKDWLDAQDQFMARVYDRLGSRVLHKELTDIGLENTSHYDRYEDETQNEQTFLAEGLEPMPEARDYYIGADILLLRRDKMANLILDTRMYQVEFAGDKVTELTNNVITESMHALCDADRNEYLLLDLLVGYEKNKNVLPSHTNRSMFLANKYPVSQLQVGIFAVIGRVVLPQGRSYPT